jgi:hypothetical protein
MCCRRGRPGIRQGRNDRTKSQKVILWAILRLTFAADPDSV